MEEKIKNIINRQFQRLKTALQPLDVPEPVMDSVSKYIRFMELDIIESIRGEKENKDYGNQKEY